MSITRRTALASLAATAALPVIRVRAAESNGPAELTVDPTPRHEISPYLFMQFMEPLGTTDSSVEAAWDHLRDDWREDVVEATRQLAPTMLRWGGIYTDYYRWREGVGPRDRRPPMHNLLWGGLESNQVGTAEFVDFSRRVGAEPLMCVNFESDGRPQFREAKGSIRTADAKEAAEWVAYCNQPKHAERIAHGHQQPHNIRYWQIGNETSYDNRGFKMDEACRKTEEFITAMRASDPEIQIIAWGDSGWAPTMADRLGDRVQMLAFHHMFDPDRDQEPVLRGEQYRQDPAATWDRLMNAWQMHDRKIRQVRESLAGRTMPLAMTECHYAIPGRNRCDVLSTWAAGVSYGRVLNTTTRHADAIKIATAADFCGTRWQVNAVMIPVPRDNGRAYLMPVSRVMQLYRQHIGNRAATVLHSPDELDVVATCTGDKLFLHVVNTARDKSSTIKFRLPTGEIKAATAFTLADDPMVELSHLNADRVMQVARRELPGSGEWTFPAASVSAVEIELAEV